MTNVVDGVRFIVQQLVNSFNFLNFDIYRYSNTSVTFLDLLFFVFVFYLTMKFFIFRH